MRDPKRVPLMLPKPPRITMANEKVSGADHMNGCANWVVEPEISMLIKYTDFSGGFLANNAGKSARSGNIRRTNSLGGMSKTCIAKLEYALLK